MAVVALVMYWGSAEQVSRKEYLYAWLVMEDDAPTCMLGNGR
jgi:hypothetical protein